MKIKKTLAVIFTVLIVIGITCFSCFAADGEVSTGFSEDITSPSIIESSGTDNSALRIERTKIYNKYGKLDNTAMYQVDGTYFLVDFGDTGYIASWDHSTYGPRWNFINGAKLYQYTGDTWSEVETTTDSLGYGGTCPYSSSSLIMAYNDIERTQTSIKGNYTKLVGFGSITTNDFKPVMSGIKSLLPVIVPVVVGYLALRKGWRFVKGETAGA